MLVDLSTVRDSAVIPPTIARALAPSESIGSSPAEFLVSFLRWKRTLLVLDNAEQVRPAMT